MHVARDHTVEGEVRTGRVKDEERGHGGKRVQEGNRVVSE